MLARMLRYLIGLQMLVGAVLGFWVTLHVAPNWTLLGMALGALALPLAGAVLADICTCAVSRADEPAGAWWRSLVGESRAGIQVFLLRQPWAFAAPRILPAQGPARIPVLLVHGYVCNHRIWDAMAPALRAQGHTLLAINLEPVFTSIDDYAEQVEQAVQSLRQQSGHDRVALVGHSMGGLAVRAWMRRFGSAHAARVITLGTPHVGTQIKTVVPTPNAQQMGWHSDWLQQLAASENEGIRSLFRIGLSPQDNIVFPQRAQTLPGVTPVVFEGLGHLQLCTAPPVIRWVGQELAQL